MQNYMDYIFFIYGFSLLLMGCVAWSAWENKPPLPWRWLAGFGFMHGMNEWLGLLALSFPPSPGFKILRFAFSAASFAFLLEFGLRSLKFRARKWIYLLAILLTASGGYLEARSGAGASGIDLKSFLPAIFTGGLDGMSALARYSMGLPGAFLTGAIFWKGSSQQSRKMFLRLLGTAFLVYGASNFIPSPAHFFPADILNTQTFISVAGFPIQVIRALCASTAAFSLWFLYAHDIRTTTLGRKPQLSHYSVAATIMFIVAFGWFTTAWQGKNADIQIRQHMLAQARKIANTIPPALVKKLSFSAEDRDSPYYQQIRSHLVAYGKAVHFDSIYSMILHDSEILFGPENLPVGSPYSAVPGTPYEEPPPELQRVFSNNEAVLAAPYTDEYGSFISAFTPVYDAQGKKLILVIGVDFETDWYTHQVMRQRLPLIIFTMALAGFLFATIFFFRKMKETGEQTARWRPLRETVLISICGMAITFSITFLISRQDTIARRDMFRQVADGRETTVSNNIKNILALQFDSFRAYFLSNEFIARDDFRSFASSISANHILPVFRWLPRIPGSALQEFETAARQAGLPDFSVHEFSEDGRKIPAAHRDMHYPVHYVEPAEDNDYAPGYDVASNPEHMQAITLAETTGIPAATNPVPIVHKGKLEKPLFVFYSVHKPLENGAGFRQQQDGMIMAEFLPQDLLDKSLALDDQTKPITNAHLFQLSPDEPPLYLASSPPLSGKDSPPVFPEFRKDPALQIRTICPFFIFDRTYAIVQEPGIAFLDAYPKRYLWSIPLFGVLLTALLAFIAETLGRNRQKLEREVEHRTLDLIATNALLETANQAKSRFLAHMSHELRTPLNVILGFSEILEKGMLGPLSPEYAKQAQDIHANGARLLSLINALPEPVPPDESKSLARMSNELLMPVNAILAFSETIEKGMLGPLSPKYAEYAQDIHTSGTHLLSLINDVLDLSKIEAGKFTLLPTSIDITALVRDCARMNALIMEKKGLRFHLAAPESLPRVKVDERAIRQVVLNLLSNAIKFTPADGTIGITLQHDAGHGVISLEIADSGIGIAPENLGKIFEPFQQETPMVAKKFGGTGLGLAISRDLVRMHGGDMVLQSTPGIGTRISFTLPVVEANLPPGNAP